MVNKDIDRILRKSIEHFVEGYKFASNEREKENTDNTCKDFIKALIPSYKEINLATYLSLYESLKTQDEPVLA